ncbi:MAG: DUF4190 domain-containing protein [Sedimentisphaerales bacterium]|nr:DUF4190 domain-containing protein [Sedimentisphaerales bacterium]
MEENSQQPPVATAQAQAPVQSVAPHRGVLILVLGILGIVCCFICGIVAWVMGNNDMREIDAGRMDPTGRGLTQAGKICGMVGVILSIVAIVMQVIFMLLGMGAGLLDM